GDAEARNHPGEARAQAAQAGRAAQATGPEGRWRRPPARRLGAQGAVGQGLEPQGLQALEKSKPAPAQSGAGFRLGIRFAPGRRWTSILKRFGKPPLFSW